MACILLVITALNSVDFEDSEKLKVSLEQFLMRFLTLRCHSLGKYWEVGTAA